jgi:hypothetical protein
LSLMNSGDTVAPQPAYRRVIARFQQWIDRGL